MKGTVWKRCPCGDTGRGGVPACKKAHGTWTWRADADSSRAGPRRQPSKGGYPTKPAAEKALADYLSDGSDDLNQTVGQWLTTWLKDRRELVDTGSMEESTYVGYESSVRTFLIPHLGHLRLRDLRHHHVEQMVRDGRTPSAAAPPDHSRTRVKCGDNGGRNERGQPCGKWACIGDTRCNRHGGAPHLQRGRVGRVVETRSAATLNGHRRVLRNALAAAKRRDLISSNPAEGRLESLPKEGRPDTKWWQPDEVAAFVLDLELGVQQTTPGSEEWAHAVQEDALYDVAAFGGPRRGELGGMEWANVDITSALAGIDLGPSLNQLAGKHACYRCGQTHVGCRLKPGPKSRAGWRWVPLVPLTSKKLGRQLAGQAVFREKWEDAYVDHGLVFAREDGNPLSPEGITESFQARAERLGLPRIRLHDMRHGAASLLIAAGVPMETVALIIGHAQISTVREIYQHIIKAPASAGMEAAVKLVRGDPGAQIVHSPDPAVEPLALNDR